MDASQVLRRQGWRGVGYSLDKNDRGIVHPLMIKFKDNTLGLGKDARTLPSDQWWLRAFDESLQMMGTGAQTTLSKVAEKGMNAGGGLYTFFVRGGKLEGTIDNEPGEEAPSNSRKRKRDSLPLDPTKPAKVSRKDKAGKTKKKESEEDGRSRRRSRKSSPSDASTDSAELAAAPPQRLHSHTPVCDPGFELSIKPRKLASYRTKAAAKGITLEQYIQKKQAKQAKKERRERRRAKRQKQ